MKACLINPPQTQLRQPKAYIPLGLAYIGAVLEEDGVKVKVLNLADYQESRIKELCERLTFPEVDWTGISCVSATYHAVKDLVTHLKGKSRIAVGGVHASVLPLKTYNEMKPDVVVTGEAEFLLRDLVVGKVKPSPVMEAGIIRNLNTLPFPARHLFREEDVVDCTGIHGQEKGVPATSVITSRGCPYSCNFCCKGHSMFTTYRYRNARNVKEELKLLIHYYGVEHIRFVDDEFTLNNRRTKDLCTEIKGLGLTWVCITRADSLSKTLLKAMKEAGCVEVHIGVESGSNRILNLMNKRVTVETLLKTIRMIKKVGVRVKTYLMYGYPGETEEDRSLTLSFLRKAKPDKYTISRFTALPGSKTYNPSPRREPTWFYPDEDLEWNRFKQKIEEAMK